MESVAIWSSQLEMIINKTRELDKDLKERNKSLFQRGEKLETEAQLCMSTGSCRLLARIYFVLKKILSGKHLCDYRLVLWSQMVSSTSPESRLARNIGFWCMNPAVVFGPLAEETRCVLLSSGTLAPMDTFSCELGTTFPQMTEAMHVIDSKTQLYAASFARGPSGEIELKGTFGEMDKFAFQDDICQAILDICKIVPYGVLCFVPSYGFLDKLIRRMKATKRYGELERIKEVYLEQRSMSNGNFEKLIGKYRQSISRLVADPQSMGKRTGCVFFAVFRGKVSEGLDFVDENARAVISIGIPYPALKDEKIVLKREFNDQTRGSVLNGSNWYEKQAFRAINQALGRCIRHKDDWGAIILLESRFQQQRCLDQLSKWIRPSIRQVRDFYLGLAELKAFIDGKYPRGLLAMSKPTLDPSDSDKGDSDTEGHAPVWKT